MRSYSTTKKFLLDGSSYSSGNGLTAILVIQDLLNSNGQFMSYQEFENKYACKMYFLQSYQVVSTIPKHLATKAKNTVPLFQLDDLTTIYISKAKTRDIYCSFNTKAHTRCDNGTKLGGLPHEKESELWGPMTSGSSVSLESPITGCGASIPQNFAVRAISQSRKDCRKDRYHIGNKSRSPSLQVQQGWLVHSRGIPTKRGDYPRLILEL